MMDGVCVVVSPLISLIQVSFHGSVICHIIRRRCKSLDPEFSNRCHTLESTSQDQLRMLPPRIPAATLSGSPSAAQTAAIIDDIQQGRIKILFVSPERLVSPSFRRLFHTRWDPDQQKRTRQFPEISLLCIDEAHCASHWAHNFRPSFLRFKSLLHLMQPKSVLAITATAGSRVIDDIRSTLGIQDKESDGVRVMKSDRDNIDVSCLMLGSHEERLSMVRAFLLLFFRRYYCLKICLSHGLNTTAAWEDIDAQEEEFCDPRRYQYF